MKENNEMKVQFCTFDEIAELLISEDRLVFIDAGIAETVGKYEDIPDIIVDLNLKVGNMDLKIYDFDGGISKPLLSTFGIYLNKCDPNVRKDIIERLVKLQTNEEKIKKYKLIDEYDLEGYYEFLDGDDEYGRNE